MVAALFLLTGPLSLASDRIAEAGFTTNEALALESLPGVLNDQAAALAQVLAETKVQAKLSGFRESLERQQRKLVVTGFLAEMPWRGRYREVLIGLGAQSASGTITALGELMVRTFTDPSFETAVLFQPAR